MTSTFSDVVERLLANGYTDIVPVLRATKKVVEAGWQNGFSEEQIRAFAANGYSAGNTGLLSRSFTGLDADIRNRTLSKHVYDATVKWFGMAPVRIGLAPKWLMLFRLKGEPHSKFKVRLVNGESGETHTIEVLASGQQFVIFGIHPDTGKEYVWRNGSPLDTPASELKCVSRAELVEFFKQLAGALPAGWGLVWPEDSAEAGLVRPGFVLKDPREKSGLVGAFCRAFSVEDLIEGEMSEEFKFEGNSDTRLTYLKSDSGLAGGAVVLGEARMHVFNQHNSSPCGDRAVNLFDWVRLHKFGHLDTEAIKRDTFDVTALPSYQAMVAWASELPEVIAELDSGRFDAPAMPTLGQVDENPAEAVLDRVEALSRNLVKLGSLPEHDWPLPHFVDLWIPEDEVTLLAGHGGGGKSYVALSVAVHVALGLPFGPLQTSQANVLFFSGEDSSRVLKQRLGRLCRALKINPAELEGKLYILDASDIDPALHREQRVTSGHRQQTVTETQLLDSLAGLVQKLDVRLVVVDNASDTFDDDEIRRARVRAFIRSLRSRIARPGRAVLLLAHVNKVSAAAGRNAGGEDYSGSTAWHNSARSRLSLTPDGANGLKIEHMKANLGAKALPIRLEWHDGAPLVVGCTTNETAAVLEAARDRADKLALAAIIKDFDRRGENVSTAMNGPYTVFRQLSSDPAFPKGTKPDRLIRLLRDMERDGQVFRREVRTPARKTKEVFTCVPEQGGSAPNAGAASGMDEIDQDFLR